MLEAIHGQLADRQYLIDWMDFGSATVQVLQLRGQSWPALRAFHAITRGNAEALDLAERIGSIEVGHEADLVLLDSRATPAMAHRMAAVDGDLAEELFVLMMLGDDRAIAATYVAGRPVVPSAFIPDSDSAYSSVRVA